MIHGYTYHVTAGVSKGQNQAFYLPIYRSDVLFLLAIPS